MKNEEVNNKNIMETKKFTLGDRIKIDINVKKDLNDKDLSKVENKVYIITTVYKNNEYLVALGEEKYKLKGESLNKAE